MEHYIRKGDALILVCQNNAEQSLVIQEVNPEFEKLTGYKAAKLVGKPLKEVLGHRVRELLDDYLEYEDDAYDMQEVLSKVTHGSFSVKKKNGQEKFVVCKIVRSNAYDKHHWFRIILRDEKLERADDKKRSVLRDNFRGYEKLDEVTGLPDYATLQKDMELVQHYVASGEFKAIYVLVRSDDFIHMMSFGRENAVRAMKHISSVLQRNLRQEDRICVVSESMLGMLLTDITIESARVVLNRLRWQVVSDRFRVKDNIATSLNIGIAYCAIEGDNPSIPMQACLEKMNEYVAPNAMLEVALETNA